jgi:hypothetical protein
MNAMGPLPLPTDNLYKFCALTGVAVILFSLYAGWRFSDDLRRRMNTASLAAKKAEIEMDFLKDLTGRTEKTVNDLKVNQSDEDIYKEGKVPLHISSEELRKGVERVHELYRDMRLKLAEVDSANDEIYKAGTNINLVRFGSLFLLIVGNTLAFYGFRKWFALQKMQDKALERQLTLPSTHQ